MGSLEQPVSGRTALGGQRVPVLLTNGVSADEDLVDTGADTRVLATTSLLLVGIGLLLVPTVRRRR